MKKIIWEVQSLSLLPVLKYCKKCGRKNLFACSRQFRVNAQRRYLDIWLIYKCCDCNTTWNATVYSRISPQAIKPPATMAYRPGVTQEASVFNP